MSRIAKWTLLSGLTSIVVLVGWIAWFPRQIPTEASILRQEFAYTSLKSRLAFEGSPRANEMLPPAPDLPEHALDRLKAVETTFESFDSQARLRSLQILHSNEVASFIRREGSGLSRMGRLPGRELLPYEEPAAISLASDTGDASDEPFPESTTIEDNRFVELPSTAPVPSRKQLEEFHLADQISFVDPWSLGDIQTRELVAGFVSHGFRYLPVIGDSSNGYPRAHVEAERRPPENPGPWRVTRLELVSLLKFEEPAVYISDYLPRMQDLSDARTRPLSEFERQGLDALRSGEDLYTTNDSSQILMVGSLRAAKQCLECHSGGRGKLLGAFSYRLERHPRTNRNLRDKAI